MNITPRSNIANKVRNTNLPTTKGLMALFEVISNSIHAINEAKGKNLISDNGKISIKICPYKVIFIKKVFVFSSYV